MNPVEEGLKAALRLKEVELLRTKLELWREKYNRAGEQYDRYEKELKEKEVK
jgi:hypothetical protein